MGPGVARRTSGLRVGGHRPALGRWDQVWRRPHPARGGSASPPLEDHARRARHERQPSCLTQIHVRASPPTPTGPSSSVATSTSARSTASRSRTGTAPSRFADAASPASSPSATRRTSLASSGPTDPRGWATPIRRAARLFDILNEPVPLIQPLDVRSATKGEVMTTNVEKSLLVNVPVSTAYNQ